ncbi:sigma-70 family RNA polymerase sigma factor [Jiangella ureilytica]|uniref:Sigma-70 family RNA polymerase sigma factor n=1 Tax=Jiangella ureilytica TaxID=2530374 RepID=A0A4R4S568_9ACTN|nr:sigma-70 family RNA polymerase sigma factor [Jiangella ureilytica]TDC56712.1 sigma-70 family RNA polymerase sigma factor [Jiangella ureilytica]
MTDGGAAARAALADAVAAERVRIVAALIRVTGDFDLAEDCLQDAVERALEHWPADGVPANPGAWLTTIARRRANDVLRRRQTERAKLREAQALAELERDLTADEPGPYGDDRLKLLFTCCHPALPMAGRVALTLKSVGGLSTRQIARAFLVGEATMGQRLLRTKNKIEHAGIGFRVPEPHRLAERTAAVLAVVYLIFTEGYAATEGEPFRDDLAAEAVQLSGLVAQLLPDDDEALGLHALLLLQHARRAARTDAGGELVTLEDQDRGRWDHDRIEAGLAALSAARATGRAPGYYRLQAEIAALHSTAAHARDTDWARIVAAYDALLALRPSPVVALNRAVAVGFRDGPAAGLAALDDVAGDLGDYPPLTAVRADLLRRSGRPAEAATAYREAAAVARTEPERRFLERRLREVSEP